MIFSYYHFLVPIILVIFVSTEKTSMTSVCEYYNINHKCNSTDSEACQKTERCKNSEVEKESFCFALWKNDTKTGLSTVILKGCWTNEAECHNQTRCVEKSVERKEMFFCCCEGDMCNRDFAWEPSPPSEQPKVIAKNPNSLTWNAILLYTIFPILALSFALALLYWYYNQRKLSYFNQVPSLDSSNCLSSSPLLGTRPIQLIEMKACGRFGAVWKAQYKTDLVAVKIFSLQDKQLWLTEQEIFKLAHMNHENILQFIGVEKHGSDLDTKFWLISEYHPHGSLCDFLKANVINWQQFCRIGHSMAKGLMHLHEELPPTKADGYKPAVAHRDFKSTNVLLKSDLTACIADFNLALIFHPGKPCGDVHGQVGTRRYWAPEVLEGAINFSRDAFLRIDMYACGLVLWELASRCTSQMGPIPEYRLPFEEEVGQHPCLEDMQEAVVHRKQRPTIPDSWKQHKGMIALCETMEECWDHDAEARLSASCVMERIASNVKF